MLCNEVVKGEQGYLCGYQDKVFVCKQCNGNQCEGCEELPKPQFIQPQVIKEWKTMKDLT